MMDKLKELADSCACSVQVTVNENRDFYKTIEEHMEDLDACYDGAVVDPEMRAEIIKRDRLVHVRFYPGTPIGFEEVYHYDIEAAIDEALRLRKLDSWPMVPVWPLSDDGAAPSRSQAPKPKQAWWPKQG